MDAINISRKDVLWGYVSQVCNVGANLFILPVLFRFLSSELLGIWYVFMNIGAFVTLFGLVFQSAFSRNISYAFGGATILQKQGININPEQFASPNYPLVKGLIVTMRRFYGGVSIGIFILLSFIGLPYFLHIASYLPTERDIVLAWLVYALSVALGFYSLLFGSILQGRGYIKEFNQLTIICRLFYILLVFVFVSQGYSLWGIALANILSSIPAFVLGYLFAYRNRLKETLSWFQAEKSNLMSIIWANTYKLCFATVLIYISTKGNIFYASFFLPLEVIAQYGLSLQVMNVLNTASQMYFYSYSPVVAQNWIRGNHFKISEIYAKGLVIGFGVFVVGSLGVLMFGNSILTLISSNTHFLPKLPLLLLFIVYFFDTQHLLAINLLVSKNNVPHLFETIISAIAIFVLIPIFILKFDWGIYGLIGAVGIVQACCHNWKWPVLVSRELGISLASQVKTGLDSLLHVKLKNK